MKLNFSKTQINKKLVQSNIALYCKYSIDAGDQYQYLILTILVRKKIFFIKFKKSSNNNSFKIKPRYQVFYLYLCGSFS